MISSALLRDVAKYIDGRVAKVVINGTFEITDFEVKNVTENVLVLNYIVPVEKVSWITLVELKDASGNVLSSNAVNVPITADHLMVQTIEIKEAI
ncbi:ketopantoate hydroxymethyltransferase [Paenibacillus thiaminolyticus]|uniref:ketopantoate hydroxymethyltransferase n=2 Tax=Paenibacillus thiaminolyticus TaxID=49283 RepID=UPI001164D7BB|nr:ketopantoate hydroxymethyltransferase [Paenibacillus thiaminolyticus]NGP58142.1 ketopantoate hydroxymethyltransferase [Paenibacillus thiaminolyticus]NGP58786.1 ketopantoate hydroxymethyltransferase [Paenibacillus thiaminolyticus]NGP60049.1 ketopantoate hydroxymethyltransferase [Paenibacillus thiaminolyticus]